MTASHTVRLRGRRYALAAIQLLTLLFVSPALADEFPGIVFFGDSLSDPGNHFVAFGTVALKPYIPVPDDSYPIGGHHFTNGATWAEQLARRMKLPTSGKPALREPGHFTNYAVGRARARAGAPVFPLYDLSAQVDLFLTDFSGQAPTANLYVLWIGSNDLSDALNALSVDPTGQMSFDILQQALASLAYNTQLLWAAGAKTFLVPDLPNPAFTPYLRALGPVAQGAATQLATLYNQALADTLVQLEGLPGTRFIGLDINALFAELLADPEVYGFENVEGSCLTFGVTANATCRRPQRYLFWDGAHPTKTGHSFVAEAALSAIESD
jgi:outer membrane lipase/esterase